MRLYIFLFLFILCCGCKKKVLGPEEYIAWVEDEKNGLKVRKEIGEYVFECQYMTADYVAAIKGKKIWPAEKKENEVGLEQYRFKITAKGKNQEMLRTGIRSEEEYQYRISYFSFPAQRDFTLQVAQDTLPCVLYHFERSYNLAPYSTILLGFATSGIKQKAADRHLTFDDKALGVGKVHLIIKSADITNIPQLITE